MKTILEFTQEDNDYRNIAIHSMELWSTLWGIQNELRSYRKYHEGQSDDELKAAKNLIARIESDIADIAHIIDMIQ